MCDKVRIGRGSNADSIEQGLSVDGGAFVVSTRTSQHIALQRLSDGCQVDQQGCKRSLQGFFLGGERHSFA
jgi:hypothetical protein